MSSNRSRRRILRIVLISALIAIIYFFGVWTRVRIVERLDEFYGRNMYVRESALYFYFAKELAENDDVPRIDHKAQHPGGFDVAGQHAFLKGKLTAKVYRLMFRGRMSFERFARRFDSVFFCLGVVPFFLLMRRLSGSDWLSILGSAVYVMAVPVVQRSSGAGFNMETFSIPILIAHIWLFVEAIHRNKLWISGISGIALAIAVAGWDFCQFYLILFGIFLFLSVLFFEDWTKLVRHAAVILPPLLLAAILDPYLRAHSFIVSYGMLLLYPVAGAGVFSWFIPIKKLYIAPGIVVLYLILTVFTFLFFDYSNAYSHVSRKFYSKIKNLNSKPVDPGKLTFTERIEWTPPFHSATEKFGGTYPFVQMLRYTVPALVPLVLFTIGFFRRKRDPSETLIFYNLVVFVLLYLMFSRLKVVLAVFLVLSLGVGWRYFPGIRILRSRLFKAAWVVLLVLILFFDIAHCFPLFSRKQLKKTGPTERASEGRWLKYFERLRKTNLLNFAPEELFRMVALRGLVEAVEKGTNEDAAVLASYKVSPTILAYTGRRIILHPKFEVVEMRKRVREYYEDLFSESEQDLNDFCNKYRADYFVFDDYIWRSDRDSPFWVYSSKYIANADKDLYGQYAFRHMVSDDQSVSFFRPVPAFTVSAYEPAAGTDMVRYKLYEVVKTEDREKAEKLVVSGAKRIGKGQYLAAVGDLQNAINLFPGLSADAYTKLGTAYRFVSTLVAREALENLVPFSGSILSAYTQALVAAELRNKADENWKKARTFMQQGRQ